MTKTRRQYTAEYKPEAVTLAKQSQQPISQTAVHLGINDNLLRRWIKEYDQATGSQKAFPGQGVSRDEEVARLKRELAQAKRERDFLREAAAYFAKQPQ